MRRVGPASGLSRTVAQDRNVPSASPPRISHTISDGPAPSRTINSPQQADGDQHNSSTSSNVMRKFQALFSSGRSGEADLQNGSEKRTSKKPAVAGASPAVPSPSSMPSSSSDLSNEGAATSMEMEPRCYVYVCGDNVKSQLGIFEHNGKKYWPHHVPKSYRLSKFKNKQITHLSCGWDSTFIVSDSGELWAMGNNEFGSVVPVCEEVYEGAMDNNNKSPGGKGGTTTPPPAATQDLVTRPHKMEFTNQPVRSVVSSQSFTVVTFESGAAVVYGCNEFGQFGLGPGSSTISPMSPVSLRLKYCNPVSMVSVGRDFILVLSKTGQVYSCGNGANGCLGLAEDADTPALESKSELCVLPALAGLPIQQIAAGEMHALASSISGQLFSWGYNRDGRLGLSETTTKPSSPVAGKSTTSILRVLPSFTDEVLGTEQDDTTDDEGVVDRSSIVVSFPTLVSSLTLPVKLVAAGGAHSAVLLAGGTLKFCGLNDHGQCGVCPSQARCVPRFRSINLNNFSTIPSSSSTSLFSPSMSVMDGTVSRGGSPTSPWTFVACGSSHSLIVNAEGRAFSFGRNVEGQLGIRSTSKFEFVPHEILLSSRVNLFVYCCAAGGHHSIFAAVRAGKGVAGESVSPETPSKPWAVPPLRGMSADVTIPLVRMMSEVRNPKLHYRAPLSSTQTPCPAEINVIMKKQQHFSEFKSGYTCKELIECINNCHVSGDYAPLTHLIKDLFSNSTRLNCSFLLPGRRTQMDIGGLEHFYTLLFDIKNEVLNKLLSDLSNALVECFTQQIKENPRLYHADQLRFLLITLHCPMFAQGNIENAKVFELAMKILVNLPLTSRQMLSSMITALYSPELFERRLLAHTKSFISYAISSSPGKPITTLEKLWDGVLFMQLLYVASQNCTREIKFEESERRPPKVPSEHFALDFITGRVDPGSELHVFRNALEASRKAKANNSGEDPGGLNQATASWSCPPESVLKCSGPIDTKYRFFLAHMFLCPLAFKKSVVSEESATRQKEIQIRSLLTGSLPFFLLIVRRNSLVQDALHQVCSHAGPALLSPLRVTFAGEEGQDEGGLRREFFRLAVKQLFDPKYGMFVYNTDTRLTWFTEFSIDADQEYFFVGCLLGLAIYNDVLLDLRFPLLLYKKLLGKTSFDLSDLAEIQPELAKSYMEMLREDAWTESEFEDAFGCMTFSLSRDFFGEMQEIELTPNGKNIPLTLSNRYEYVQACLKYFVETSVEKTFGAFQRGFLILCNPDLFKALSPEELKILICGIPDISMEDLKEGTQYFGFTANDPYVGWFWEVVFSFSDFLKKKFLYFCTGNDRVPIGGLQELHLKIERNGGEPTEHLPTSHTCFNHLLLPQYESKAKLRKLLTMAIENSEGFGLQ